MEMIHKQKMAELESLSEHRRTQQVPVPEDREGIIKDAEMMATAGNDTTIEQKAPAAIKTTETSPPAVGTPRRLAFVIPLSKPQGVNHVESNVTTGVHPTAM